MPVSTTCHYLMSFDHEADNQLPSALNNQLCVRDDNTSIAIGKYDDQATMDKDIARLG